jgi:hypothetical protein
VITEHSSKVVVRVKETSPMELTIDSSLLLLKPQNTKLDGLTSVEKLLKDGSQTIAACFIGFEWDAAAMKPL